MNYILSKYTFAVSKRTSSGQEICLLFSGRTGKNILVSKKVFSIVENGKFTTLQPKVLEILISEKVLVPSTEDELDEINKEIKCNYQKNPLIDCMCQSSQQPLVNLPATIADKLILASF